MKEYNVEYPNGVGRGSYIVLGGPLNVGLRHLDESVLTSIPERFSGGRMEGENKTFNGRVVRQPQVARNTDNSS